MNQSEAHKITKKILAKYAVAGFDSWQISIETIVQDAIEEWEKMKCKKRNFTNQK